MARTKERMQELVLIQPIRAAENDCSREAAQAAKRREFEARLAECGPLAFRVARGILRNDADAEDVAQEALLRAYRRFDRLRDAQRFRGWLVRIVFRLALDRARSELHLPMRKNSRHRPNFRCISTGLWTLCRKSCDWSCCSRLWKATLWKK